MEHPGPSRRDRRLPPDPGTRLLLVFLAATLLIVGGVVAAAVVDRWWVLVPLMCVDFGATFAVMANLARLLDDDRGSSP